jgi:hypothetical protein
MKRERRFRQVVPSGCIMGQTLSVLGAKEKKKINDTKQALIDYQMG